MKTAHLSETEIQQVVLEPSKTGATLKQHVSQCLQCQAKAANYRIVFNAIIEQEVPVFDFDLSALVMAQVVVPQKQTRWFAICFYALVLLIISALAFIVYGNWAYRDLLTAEVSPTIVAILCVSAVSIVFFQFWINYQKHRGQMQALDGF